MPVENSSHPGGPPLKPLSFKRLSLTLRESNRKASSFHMPILSILEADSASGGIGSAVTRSGVKRESIKIDTEWRFRMLESDVVTIQTSSTLPSRFKVVLIKEGLGNLGTCYFYTAAALSSATGLFEGVKCYANHPKSSEEIERPERDVRDVIGHFENVAVVRNSQGQMQLEADLVVLPGSAYDWVRSQIVHSIDYAKRFPDRDFVGLSINCSGDSELTDPKLLKSLSPPVREKLDSAMAQGMTAVRVVSILTDAVSCDLVTEAGAGGRIIRSL